MINELISKSLKYVKEHSPEILIGAGVVGMCTSTVLAVKATPKALTLIKEKEEELDVTHLTKKEIVQATWKQYAPSVGVGVLSVACIIGGTSKSIKRNTALATVYALSESTLKEYQRKTKEIVGEEKAREIDRQVAKSRAKEKQIVIQNRDSEYVHHTSFGDNLIYDTMSGRYFRSSTNAIEAAVNSVNKLIIDDGSATVNDFYNELDIPCVVAGNMIGWKYEKEQLEITFDSDIDKMGNPFLILTYRNRPIPLDGYHYYN